MANLSTEDTEGFVEFFGSSDIVKFVEGVSLVIARSVDPFFDRQLRALLDDLFNDLRALAVKVGGVAEVEMVRILNEKRKRPQAAGSENLEDHIKARPYPGLEKLGGVGVADKEELTKVDYWKVIEEGSEATYPDFVGRQIYGTYSGGPPNDKPRREFAEGSESTGPHATFIFARDGGSPKGIGEIRHHIAPRHYIRDGAGEAWKVYVREIEVISRTYAARLTRIDGQRRRRALGTLPIVP